MDLKKLTGKIKSIIEKYKFVLIIIIIGISLMLIPGKTEQETKELNETAPVSYRYDLESLSEILQSVEGAGNVKVLLSVDQGEKTIYQTNQDISGTGESANSQIETVIVTDAQRNESGLINQVNPPTYLGAIVVCQGADSPAVRLAITQAVSKITGLGTDNICVLKMK